MPLRLVNADVVPEPELLVRGAGRSRRWDCCGMCCMVLLLLKESALMLEGMLEKSP